MLIRFVLENVLSFGERKEFNMLPYTRLNTLMHHVYPIQDIGLLKMAAIYGANGAGKSNLIKAIHLLKRLVTDRDLPINLKESQFKFNEQPDKSQLLAIEFLQDNKVYYYGIELTRGIISTEELYESGLGKKPDTLLFERKTDSNKKTTARFMAEFEQDEKSQLLKQVLLEEFVQPEKPMFKILANRDNRFLSEVKKAYQWFEDTLQIIMPEAKPPVLAHHLDQDAQFKKYAEELMRSFSTGIVHLETEKKEIREFFGEDDKEEAERLSRYVDTAPGQMISLRAAGRDEKVIVKENDKVWVKSLKLAHINEGGQPVWFDLAEESDGTIRLLDFVPALKEVIASPKVFLIDEIERSIHPLLIKELLKKFSLDPATQGQLIFTTHESNLLDQSIFRQDETWFVEKDTYGSSDLYTLSAFKEHKTIDIRKGYLSGRYGSIPFLANLTDLNWHEYVDSKQAV
ncbi:MAG TPA: ATP-binding protein [Saprospiraceae bacterium]|nr:ATP-binding protein [Saprospiraceae bacterium]HMQ82016.1 ATP-binding protein [Saprospiraceae bacterium]